MGGSCDREAIGATSFVLLSDASFRAASGCPGRGLGQLPDARIRRRGAAVSRTLSAFDSFLLAYSAYADAP